jgi:sugar/nucleoside kinase (ribokinase family)
VPDEFISSQELQRGGMTLMDTDRQASILHQLTDHKVELASGGSAANTMVAIAQSGGSGFYCGKVAHDMHGEFYRQDMQASGIQFDVTMAPERDNPTGTCVVLTTPDAERTMCTHLGVSTSLHKDDVNLDHLAACRFSYVEGYLWDAEGPREACIETFRQSKRLGLVTSFTFSDPFLVDRYHREFLELVPQYCDVLFCNADEAKRLCESDSLADCAKRLGEMAPTVFLTDGPNGCLVVLQGDVARVPGFQVQAIDTVGAGDAFAGGVLFGLAKGMGALQAARWGNYMASRVVATVGPRLPGSMSDKVTEIAVV